MKNTKSTGVSLRDGSKHSLNAKTSSCLVYNSDSQLLSTYAWPRSTTLFPLLSRAGKMPCNELVAASCHSAAITASSCTSTSGNSGRHAHRMLVYIPYTRVMANKLDILRSKKALNVDSPTFTPAITAAAAKKPAGGLSTQAANAPSFTPRGLGGISILPQFGKHC